MGGVSIIFYVGLTLISENILADTIAAVGLMIAFYYGLTGFACVWFYRKTMWAKPARRPHAGRAARCSAASCSSPSSWSPARRTPTPDYGYTQHRRASAACS